MASSPFGGSVPPHIANILEQIAVHEQRIRELDEELRALDRGLRWSREEWRERLAASPPATRADDQAATLPGAPTTEAMAPPSRHGQVRLVRQPGRPAAKQAHRKRH